MNAARHSRNAIVLVVVLVIEKVEDEDENEDEEEKFARLEQTLIDSSPDEPGLRLNRGSPDAAEQNPLAEKWRQKYKAFFCPSPPPGRQKICPGKQSLSAFRDTNLPY